MPPQCKAYQFLSTLLFPLRLVFGTLQCFLVLIAPGASSVPNATTTMSLCPYEAGISNDKPSFQPTQ